MILTISALVKTFRALADGSMSITFDTNELTPNEYSSLGQCLKKSGVLVFKPDVTSLTSEEMKAIENIDLRVTDDEHYKSPSKRMRSVLFLLFKKDNEGFKTFDSYYDSKMEKIIGFYKSRLDTVTTEDVKSK